MGESGEAKQRNSASLNRSTPKTSLPTIATTQKYANFNELLEDFVWLSPVSIVPLSMMVSSAVPVNSFGEFLKYAKANPQKLNYASLGTGSTPMLAAEGLKHAANIQMTEVPYKGSDQITVALLAGDSHVYFGGAGTARRNVEASGGRIKVLAITGSKRTKFLPDVPTMAELGVPVSVSTWNIVAGPVGLSPDLTRRLREALAFAVANPELGVLLENSGLEPWRISHEQMAAYIKESYEQTQAEFRRLKIPRE